MLLVSGTLLIVGREMLSRNPWLIGLIIFITALVYFPLISSFRYGMDSRLARRHPSHPEPNHSINRELMRTLEQHKILRILQDSIREKLAPNTWHIFTFDPLTNTYIAAPDFSTSPAETTSDLRFQTSSSLVKILSGQNKAIYLGEPETQPAALKSDQARIALLGTPLFVPLQGRQQLLGWVAIRPPSAHNGYKKQDLESLESLCEQAALALERSQVVADLEYRVHTLNVLTRVSQGINITLSFDDTLELIYTQTNYVLPTQDFNICLYDRQSDHLYPVFYMEKDERLAERENQPVPVQQGLDHDVLITRKTLIANEYELACRSRGKLPAGEGLVSWIGVPLNAGAETIGVLSIGNRDPSVFYTQEHANLLQAIADQAAGAIVKARLLQEAERRTRQLTSLNEVARSLTSTLDLDPLLNQILNNAVNILDCEAGSLLLLDQETGELIFEVTVGPVANDILNKRLPPGVGLAGRSVELRQAIIQNDVHHSKEWYSEIENETGFITRDIQVVPMLVKEQCLGVIEVINRRDGRPFTQDDQELLMAYASQAGVALENARLYTQTDQTLAARVDELSVMQRIDRELNASLDVARAMRITLDWAMRQSQADAGVIGINQSDGILLMAAQGYNGELDAFPDQVLPVDIPSIQKSIDSGQPGTLLITGQAPEKSRQKSILLNEGLAQAVIPITREIEVIGVIILENKSPISYPGETISFLTRLSDHAAIAISNAQLYTAVQAANLAKSEFVSFVSHELKTPMTSIRGFTDLLAAGVVGQVNEAQGNFLTTIRSNVDRMATLVSDLADVSRIEANRLRLDFQAVDLVELIDEIKRSAHTLIDSKDQVLELDIPSDLPNLWGDRTRLIQVLTNLINNAHKYTPSGGTILVSAQFTEHQWDADNSPMVVHISVQDNGIGINPEDQKKIFQKFFRADDQKVRDIPGTGLGLNITKTLVEMQGGKIWFESAPNQGTTFHFTVPTVENT